MLNNILEKWEEKTLDEVCTFSRGLTYSKKDEVDVSNNVVLRANNIDLVSNTLNLEELKYINDNIFIPEDKKVKENSIIMCISSGSKSHLGKVAFIDKNYGYAFGGFMGLIIPKENIIPRFLYYMLITPAFKDRILHLTDGANINNLKYSDLKDFILNIPSLSEQQRIVGLLDEAFENIEKAKQNTLQNLNNAKELFESYLKKYFEIGNSTWYKYKLSEITTKIGSGATPLGGKKAYIDSGISLIRSMNVYDREFIYEGLAHINEEQAKQLNVVTIQEKDVLLNITGASVARCCVVPSDIIPARVNQHVSIIRPKQDIVSSRFLCYLLTSNYYKNKLLKDGEEGGATRQALTKMGLEQFEVYIPNTLEEQQKIVEQLDELQEQTKNLEQIYTQKLQDLDELKQSILQKAFNGEL